MSEPGIYLDYNATTPLDERVLAVMMPYLTTHFASPASQHAPGREVARAVERAREQVAALLGAASSEEIVFTSGGTESNNLAIFGVTHGDPGARDGVVTTAMEHAATSRPFLQLAERGHRLSRLGVDAGCRVRLDEAARAIDGRTRLVSVMHANNEVGAIQPIAELGQLCREAGACFHVDGAQAAGKLAVDVQALGADLYSVVGHKLYGPKGIGALYVRDGVRLEPQALGAGHERGLRSGTPHVPGIVGLGEACELAREELEANTRRLLALRDRLEARLREGIAGLHVTCPRAHRLPHTLHLCVPGVLGAALLEAAEVVYASTGSACHRPEDPPSATLVAMGLDEALARGSVRLSLGHGVDEAQVDEAAAALIRAHASLT